MLYWRLGLLPMEMKQKIQEGIKENDWSLTIILPYAKNYRQKHFTHFMLDKVKALNRAGRLTFFPLYLLGHFDLFNCLFAIQTAEAHLCTCTVNAWSSLWYWIDLSTDSQDILG